MSKVSKSKIPDGVYLLRMVDAQEVQDNNFDDQVEVTFELTGAHGEQVGRVTKSFPLDNPVKLLVVFRACGWQVPWETVAIDLDALIGQNLECYGRIVDDQFKQVFLPLSELGRPNYVM